MAYEVAQLNNQHKCFRFLTSVHWARKKDDVELKRCKKDTIVKKAKLNKEKLFLQLKQERGTKAFSKWLSDKAISTSKAEPKECEERKLTRLASAGPSACTYCSTVGSSRGQSASSNLKIAPIKITPHQESRNLDFIGKPVKMLPYTNYHKKSLRTRKSIESRHSKISSKVSVSKIRPRKCLSAVKQVNDTKNDQVVEHDFTVMIRAVSSKSKRSKEHLFSSGLDKIVATLIDHESIDSNKNKSSLGERFGDVEEEENGFREGNCDDDCDGGGGSGADNGNDDNDDSGSGADDGYDNDNGNDDYNDGNDSDDASDDDSNDNSDDSEDECDSVEADDEREKDLDSESDDDVSMSFFSNEPDNNNSVSLPQFNFNVEDENSFFHEVGPMNDLNSLALPPVLTKGRTPAEVLQIIRRLEHSSDQSRRKGRRSFSVSSSVGYKTRHLKRRFSLGSIPEGEILYNYGDGYGASDDDKVDSLVLLQLENLIGSMKGREEEQEDESNTEKDVEEHQGQDEKELVEANGGTSMAKDIPEPRGIDTQSNFTGKDSPHPSLSTLKIVNLEWDAATNSVHSELSFSPLTAAPSHKRSSSSSTVSPADTEESNAGTPERRVTPTSRKMKNRRIASAPPTSTMAGKKTLSRKLSSPILPNAEATLLANTIQEMQEYEMASDKSDVNRYEHKKKKKKYSKEKPVFPAKRKVFSAGSDRVKGNSTSGSLSLPHTISFSDPCLDLPSSPGEWKTISPDQSGTLNLQKTSFYIEDSESSSEVGNRFTYNA